MDEEFSLRFMKTIKGFVDMFIFCNDISMFL